MTPKQQRKSDCRNMKNRLIATRLLIHPRERRKCFDIGALVITWLLLGLSKAQDFRIDNQLRVTANDCFTRIAIGSRLPDKDVTTRLPANSLSSCETACSANRTICNAFSFGIDARGNGTCAIGRMDLNMRGRDLIADPDYDVYERRPRMPRGCQADRLLRIGYGPRMNNNTVNSGNPNETLETFDINTNMNRNLNGNPNTATERRAQRPFGSQFVTGSSDNGNPPREPSFIRGGWYSPIADDSDSRLYDILNNKKNSKPNFWKQNIDHTSHVAYHHEHSSQPVDGFDNIDPYVHRSNPVDNKWSPESKWNTDIPKLNNKWNIPELNNKWSSASFPSDPSKWNFGFPTVPPSLRDISYTTPKDLPEHETRSLFDDEIGLGYPLAMGIDRVLVKTKTCYRKLLIGKRLSETHVRRNVRCNRIEECHRVCEYESTFVCEGFNYGRIQHVGRDDRDRYMCQLTSMQAGRMDLRRDFVADPRYDYYERDWRCPAEKPGYSDGDWSTNSQRPYWRPQSPLPPINGPTNELPRPPRPLDRYPLAPANTGHYLPEKSRPPINRPNDYDYYSRPLGYLPDRPPINIHYNRPQIPQYIPNDRYYPPINPTRPYGNYPKYPDRRIDAHRWPIAESQRPNEISPPERNWQKPIFGSHGSDRDWPVTPVYGPSYGYHTNHYPDNFIPPRRNGALYPRDEVIRPIKPARRPTDQQDYYGYHYGPAYGYGGHGIGFHPVDSYVPNWKPQQPQQPHGPRPGSWGGSRDCSVRSATGFKLARKCITATYTTANLEECEMLCTSRTGCLSFAYRYSLAATAPTDNCLLSNAEFEKLDFYTDLEPDRDYDIYAIMRDLWNCEGSRKSSTSLQPDHRPPEECFWRVRSGFGMPRSLTRKDFRAENGISECQIACVSARHFTCRSFVFRYESEGDQGSNCFLSDCPTSEIIPSAGDGLPYIDEAELYERGSYGRGCEPYPFATIYNSANIGKPQSSGNGIRIVNRGDEGSCYSGYPGGCKLSPYAVSTVTRVDSENECRRKCSIMRHSQHTPCMSFSYKVGDEKHGDNCYLSDVPRRDLRLGLDYTYDDDYVMYAWKELEPQCSLIGPAGYSNHGFHGLYQDPINNGARPQSNRPPPPLGPGTGLLSYNHLLLGVRPLDSDDSSPIGPADSSESHLNDDGYSFGSRPFYSNGFASFNQHYTVNGYPCKRGTKCEKNQIVGFWSCEPEGAELGSWDYCCEPNHHCGFSQGYRYPWCYVGPSEDQWRPCSDKYYPYLPSPRPAARPPPRPNGHDPLSHHHFQTLNRHDSSTYHSRHWPIAFLHPIPPPNATDSIALANDRRDDPIRRTTNASVSSKTSPRPSDIPNSSITRLELHKSHLKRRGLVTNRTRNIQPKIAQKKIHRIVIIPTRVNNETTTSRNPRYSTALNELTSTEANANYYYNSTERVATITRDEEFLDFANSRTTEHSIVNMKKASLGIIERVTKPSIKSRNNENFRRHKIISS